MANAKLKEALVVAEMKLSYSIKVRALDRPQITCSKDAEQILRSKWGGNIELLEEFNVLFVDRQNRVKSFYNLSKGGTTATVVDPKIWHLIVIIIHLPTTAIYRPTRGATVTRIFSIIILS